MKKKTLVKRVVAIEKTQAEWLEKNTYDLSDLIRTYLNEFIAAMEKTKKGIAIPAFVKAPTDQKIKALLRKNPKFKHLVD